MQVVTFLLYITAALLLVYLVIINLYLFWFSKLSRFQIQPGYHPLTRFSIIIPARDEEDNIAACLQSIVNTTYPAQLYEIIVVDDFSSDATPAIVEKFQKEFPNIQLISLKN